MDAHLFRRFGEACVSIVVGSRLVKIQEPAEGVFTFNLDFYSRNGSYGRKGQLVFRPGRKDPFLFLSSTRLASGQPPSAEIMRLRKYACGHCVRHVGVYWLERELWLLMSGKMREPASDVVSYVSGSGSEGLEHTKEQMTWLVLSLRDGAKLRFLREGELAPPRVAVWPEGANLEVAMASWRDWPVLTPALRRTLNGISQRERQALLCDLKDGSGDIYLYAKEPESLLREGGGSSFANHPRIVLASGWPLSLSQRTGLKEIVRGDVLHAIEEAGAGIVLAEAHARQTRQTVRPIEKKKKKIQALVAKLNEEEVRLSRMEQQQGVARLLQSCLWQWPVDFRARSVDVVGVESKKIVVMLDPRWTIRENMERMFHNARRGQRGLVHVAERRAVLLGELQKLQCEQSEVLLGATPLDVASKNVFESKKNQISKRIQSFVSSDGFVLLRGRDARGNQEVYRMASAQDLWVHAEGGPGAHVIIRRSHALEEVPERTLDEAGVLAALRSWLHDEPRARLTYCEIRHVKPLKGAALGTMRMDKVLFTRDVKVNVDLEQQLAISKKTVEASFDD